MKKSFIFILLVIPAYCYPADYSKENTCGPTTLYADMKGDGSKNVIVLVSEKSEERGGNCLIKSLTIYEKNKIVYEEKTTADGADELFENSEATTVVRFQKSAKEMFFSYKHWCSNCGSADVFGFIKGKYQRLSFSFAYSGKVVDLEGDGNNEIVIDPHGYYGTMP